MLDIYTDYLISSFGFTTATGLSKMLDNKLSHDKITRFLSSKEFTSKDLWKLAKPLIRRIEAEDGVIAIDDSIEEKPYTKENDLICWHYDHSKSQSLKGINFITAVYISNGFTLPIAYDLVRKTETRINNDGKKIRNSLLTKNTRYCNILESCVKNQLNFKYVLNDVWYGSADNMNFVKKVLKKDFIMPLKKNRKVALNETDKKNGRYVKIEKLCFEKNISNKVFLERLTFPVILIKQVFKNGDGSSGILYLVTSDLDLTYDQITMIYKKRWKIEEFHKSIKNNASLAKSPTKVPLTQANHFFASLCAYIKLEGISIECKTNHFAIKEKIYIVALKNAYQKLKNLMPKNLRYNFDFA